MQFKRKTAEQSRSIITLILKPDKNPCNISNYRPIALLNVYYKIAAKAIASRLKKVLHLLIGDTQSGFLRNRFIGENIRFVLDLIEYTSTHNIPGFLFFIDFEKAFDTLDWNFIHRTLHYFQFGDQFKTWVQTFYTGLSSCVFNNGHSTGYFDVKRGVRQGCPLSPYLFILCTELLARTITRNANVKGLNILNTEIKLLQYADDTVLFTDGSRDSLIEMLAILRKFQAAFGLKLNINKSNLFPLGPFVSTLPVYISNLNLHVNRGPIRFLEINFNHCGNDLYRLNYLQKLSRLKRILHLWSTRDLSPISKNVIVKSFALS